MKKNQKSYKQFKRATRRLVANTEKEDALLIIQTEKGEKARGVIKGKTGTLIQALTELADEPLMGQIIQRVAWNLRVKNAMNDADKEEENNQ